MAKFKRKRDWEDHGVRLLVELETKGGNVFPVGTIMRVTRYFGGLHLTAVQACKECQLKHRHTIKGVREGDVVLLHKWIKRPELEFESCQSCGIVRRSDGGNDTTECRGAVSVRPRKP